MNNQELNNSKIIDKEHLYNLDCFKFIFSLCILTLHVFTTYFNILNLLGLYICVDFFFIVNGFLLARSIKNKQKNELSIKFFIVRKIKTYYPIYFISFVLTFFACQHTFDISKIIELFMLQGLFITSLINPPAWYISSYLISAAGFLYLYTNIKNENIFRIVSLLLSFIILSYFIFRLKTLLPWHKNIFHIFNLGTLKSFAEITLGYWLFQYKDKIKNFFNFININSIVISLVEISVIYYIFKLMLTPNLQNYYLILQIALFMALIILLYLKKGFVSNILNIKYFNDSNRLSYPIFIGHFIFITYMAAHMQSFKILTKIIFVYGGTILYAIVINFLLTVFISNIKRMVKIKCLPEK